MKRRITFAAFFLIAATAHGLTLDHVLAHLRSKEKTVQNIKFDYVQTVTVQGVDGTDHIQGDASFKKPHQFRIVQSQPIAQQTISNGRKMWVYTPSYKQVWVGTVNSWVHSAAIPKGLIPVNDYVTELEKNFVLSLATAPAANTVLLRGGPKEDGAEYSLRLTVSTDSWLPVKSEFETPSTRIVTTFKEYDLNPTLTDKMFQFSPPKGVDVIPF